MRILHSELSADALRGVIESFVLREGTEYGERDVAMDLKVGQVLRQLEHREAHILFDPESDSVQIMLTRDLPAGHTHPT
ncbi:MAG: YheU family protein [Steroidobacteraceae bacterium]